MSKAKEICPYCGDTDLGFNANPWKQFDEGELFYCRGCGGHGMTTELTEIPELEEQESER